MNEQERRIAARRARLIARIDAERITLAQDLEPWRAPLAVVDHGLDVLRYLRNRPAWIVGGVALLIGLRPGTAGRWLRNGLLAWQLVHELRR